MGLLKGTIKKTLNTHTVTQAHALACTQRHVHMHKHTCTRFLIQPSRFQHSFPVSCKVFYMNLSPCFFGNYLSIICSIPPEFSHQAMETVVQFVDRACLPPGSSGSFVQVSRGNRKSHLHVQGFPQTCITSLSKSSCC